MLGRGRSEALGLRFASAGPVGVVRLSALTEPPAHDALTISGLAFGAVAGMAARPPMIASPSGLSRVFQYTHGDRPLQENPGGRQAAGVLHRAGSNPARRGAGNSPRKRGR